MRSPRPKRKGTAFGGGTYAQRHEQTYQAVTGAVVVGLAVFTLALHHFGFGFALIFALGGAVVCAVAGARPVVSVYVVGLSLFAGILMTPMGGTTETPFPQSASINQISPASPGAFDYELYVLEGPVLDRSHLRTAPLEVDAGLRKRNPSTTDNGSIQLPSPHSRQIFEL